MFSPKKIWQRLLHSFYSSLATTWKGIAAVLLLPLLGLFAYLGFTARIGFGPWLDALTGLLAGSLLVLLTTALLDLLTGIASRMPRPLLAWGGTAAIIVFVLGHMFSGQLLAAGLLTLCVLAVLGGLGWSAALLYRGQRSIGLWLVLVVTLGCGAWAVYWVAQPGILPTTASQPALAIQANQGIVDLPNPALPGEHTVQSAAYGFGSNARRPEYQTSSVTWTSTAVDASSFLPDLSGWRETVRRWYWGFSKESFPLNGLVWYPEGEGPFPLVLIVHGNHPMEEVSDPGYAYLAEFLASRGIITVSVDQNFLNGSWSGPFGKENHVRAWMLLQHLTAWHEWNQDPDHPLFGRVDTENLGLIGHSRGGEAAALAAAFNQLSVYPGDASIPFGFDFSIRAVAAIAPSDGQYQPADQLVPLQDFHYLTIQGSLDSDVSQFMGQSPYRRLTFSDDQYWTKSAIYVHGANHGQFNSIWSRHDLPPPLHWFLNTAPIIPETLQQRIGQFYLAAFLAGALQGQDDYFSLLRTPQRIHDFDIPVPVKGLFQDTSWTALVDFNSDIDLTKTATGGQIQGEHLSLWRQFQPAKGGNHYWEGAMTELRWETRESTYSVTLPAAALAGLDLEDWALTLVIADPRSPAPDLQPLDFTVQLQDEWGHTAALRLGTVQYPTPNQVRHLTKSRVLETRFKNAFEITPETIVLPLAAWQTDADTGFRWDGTHQLQLLFDQVPEGSLWLESVGLLRLPSNSGTLQL